MVMSPSLVDDVKLRAAAERERTAYPAGFPMLPPSRRRDTAIPAFAGSSTTASSAGRGCSSPTPTSCRTPATTARVDQLPEPIFLVRGHDGMVRALYNTCQHRGAALVAEAVREHRPPPHLPVPLVGLRPRGHARRLPRRQQLPRPRPRLPRARARALRDVGSARLRQPRPRRGAAARVPRPRRRRPQRARRARRAPAPRRRTGVDVRRQLEAPGRRQHRDLPREHRPPRQRGPGARPGGDRHPAAAQRPLAHADPHCTTAGRWPASCRSRRCSRASATSPTPARSRTTCSRT